MEKVKKIFQEFLVLKWYYQLLLSLIALALTALIIRFLIWIIPIIGTILAMLFIFTEGEFFYEIWRRYKNTTTNNLYSNVYHWLTEEGVDELPVVTLQFLEGVEFPDINQGLYFVHINKMIGEQEFLDFEIKVRQAVKYFSNGHIDAIVSKARREPFLAIKIRLVSADEVVAKERQVEEDF